MLTLIFALATVMSSSTPAARPPIAHDASCTEQWSHLRRSRGSIEGKEGHRLAMAFWHDCKIGGEPKPVYPAETNAAHPLATARIANEVSAIKPYIDSPPVDVDLFCPGYAGATKSQKITFWRTLYDKLILHESGFNANSTMWEINPKKHQKDEYSIGIFQLSVSNANGKECDFPTEWDVLNPDRNWKCGFAIIDSDLKARGATEHHSAHPSLIGGENDARLTSGLASYFGTLRSYSNARVLIIAATSQLPGCAAN